MLLVLSKYIAIGFPQEHLLFFFVAPSAFELGQKTLLRTESVVHKSVIPRVQHVVGVETCCCSCCCIQGSGKIKQMKVHSRVREVNLFSLA
jgi:hypothetical protein